MLAYRNMIDFSHHGGSFTLNICRANIGKTRQKDTMATRPYPSDGYLRQ